VQRRESVSTKNYDNVNTFNGGQQSASLINTASKLGYSSIKAVGQAQVLGDYNS